MMEVPIMTITASFALHIVELAGLITLFIMIACKDE